MSERDGESREKEYEKEIDKKVEEFKSQYELSILDEFDLRAIFKLEDEYNLISRTNIDYTRQRSDILKMRNDLKGRMARIQPIKNVYMDMYVDTNKDKCTIFYNGVVYSVSTGRFDSTTDMVDYVSCFLKSQSDYANIYIDHHGYGAMLVDVLDEKEVKYNKIKIEKM